MIQSPQRDDVVPHWAAERGGRMDWLPGNSLLVLSSNRAEAFQTQTGDFEVQNWEVSRYLVYLNNRAAGKGSVKTIDLCDQKTAPLTPKSFIYNRRSYSQAGRRGFEPRLPLHLFNNLGESGNFLHSISLS